MMMVMKGYNGCYLNILEDTIDQLVQSMNGGLDEAISDTYLTMQA